MPKKAGDSVARNANGVLHSQQTFIDALARGEPWPAAVSAANVTQASVRRWFTTDAAFKTYYDTIFSGVADEARVLIHEASGRAAETLIDLLGATKDKELTCPHCQKPFEITIEDNAIRAKVATDILKGAGQMIDRTKHDINVTGKVLHEISLPTHLRIALSRADRGMTISDQNRAELLSAGVPEERLKLKSGDDIHEAEFREVP